MNYVKLMRVAGIITGDRVHQISSTAFNKDNIGDEGE